MTGRISEDASSKLRKEIFLIMSQGDIIRTAISDRLVVAIGEM
jgi:hypothetical protein